MKRFAFVLVGLGLLVACSNNGTPATSPRERTTPTPSRTPIAGTDVVVRGTQTVSGTTAALTIEDNYFEPNILSAPGGKTVSVTLTSKGAILHNFSVTGQKIDQDVPSQGTATVQVAVPASGSVVFFCKYHKDESGMVGVFNAA